MKKLQGIYSPLFIHGQRVKGYKVPDDDLPEVPERPAPQRGQSRIGISFNEIAFSHVSAVKFNHKISFSEAFAIIAQEALGNVKLLRLYLVSTPDHDRLPHYRRMTLSLPVNQAAMIRQMSLDYELTHSQLAEKLIDFYEFKQEIMDEMGGHH